MAVSTSLLKAILAAVGASAGYIVANAADFGKDSVEATIAGVIIGYFVSDLLQYEFGTAPAATPAP